LSEIAEPSGGRLGDELTRRLRVDAGLSAIEPHTPALDERRVGWVGRSPVPASSRRRECPAVGPAIAPRPYERLGLKG
jgi:hypothetical protein